MSFLKHWLERRHQGSRTASVPFDTACKVLVFGLNAKLQLSLAKGVYELAFAGRIEGGIEIDLLDDRTVLKTIKVTSVEHVFTLTLDRNISWFDVSVRPTSDSKLIAIDRVAIRGPLSGDASQITLSASEMFGDMGQVLGKISPQDFDDLFRSLSRRVEGTHPTAFYINTRFRSHELALLNVKQLGYEMAARLKKTNLAKVVPAPPRTKLASKLCTQDDVESDWCVFWLSELKAEPMYHRKCWELGYVCQALWFAGKLAPGMRGVGFGCGLEPLPSLFAKYGAHVLATDLDPNRPESEGWIRTGQHASLLDGMKMPAICPDPALLDNIHVKNVDMNDLPSDLYGQFDFCWSTCSLEHLGTRAKGLEFIENSLKCLRPGGVAVHTTEYNFDEAETIDNWGTVGYQKADMIEFVARLTAQGYDVAPLDLNPGTGVLDGLIDIPPFDKDAYGRVFNPLGHLKLAADGFAFTSCGFIVQKPL